MLHFLDVYFCIILLATVCVVSSITFDTKVFSVFLSTVFTVIIPPTRIIAHDAKC